MPENRGTGTNNISSPGGCIWCSGSALLFGDFPHKKQVLYFLSITINISWLPTLPREIQKVLMIKLYITLPTKVHLVKTMIFSSGHLWMWGLDCEKSWVLKNWCFWIVVLEKTLESPLDCKEIKPVHPKGNQSWILIERTDAEGEISILWPPDAKNQLIGKDSEAGKDWRWKEKGTTEDEIVGWYHQLNGHEVE